MRKHFLAAFISSGKSFIDFTDLLAGILDNLFGLFIKKGIFFVLGESEIVSSSAGVAGQDMLDAFGTVTESTLFVGKFQSGTNSHNYRCYCSHERNHVFAKPGESFRSREYRNKGGERRDHNSHCGKKTLAFPVEIGVFDIVIKNQTNP